MISITKTEQHRRRRDTAALTRAYRWLARYEPLLDGAYSVTVTPGRVEIQGHAEDVQAALDYARELADEVGVDWPEVSEASHDVFQVHGMRVDDVSLWITAVLPRTTAVVR